MLEKLGRSTTISCLQSALHIWVLFSLAVVQPVYDLLSKNAEFLIAHQSGPADIILLVLILNLILPLVLVSIPAAAGLLGRNARSAFLALLVMALTTLFSIQAIKQIISLPGILTVLLAVIAAAIATFAYFRFRPLHLFLNLLSPAILIFPVLLLFYSPVNKLVFPEKPLLSESSTIDGNTKHAANFPEISAAPPVVMIVFDELPITSLMDHRQHIDPAAYPNFAALARDAYWFRNATTVSTTTVQAVPAILWGKYPIEYRLPNTTDYPDNLFTLLAGTYDLKVYEPVTQLCPPYLCRTQESALGERMRLLLSDLAVVYLHILLPKDFSAGLPIVTQTWKDFADGSAANPKAETVKKIDVAGENRRLLKTIGKELKKDRGELFRQFIETIEDTGRPTLYFYHCYLPHAPWRYLPSGKKHNLGPGTRGLVDSKWGDKELFVNEAFQNHLFQLGFVDRLLGELVDRLKNEGLYDRSLIVVTADHGISFRRNDKRRNLTQTNYMDIMPIPLFIKVPGQRGGVVSDRNVETIDIVPTIADILNIVLPWTVDGQSALDDSIPERVKKVIYTVFRGDADRRKTFGAHIDAKFETLRRKICLFAGGVRLDGPNGSGCTSDLIGKEVQKIDPGGVLDVEVEIDDRPWFEDLSLAVNFLPAYVTGRFLTGIHDPADYLVAVAVNDVFRAVTKLQFDDAQEIRFSAVVPEKSFREGKNDIALFLVDGIDGKPYPVRMASKRLLTYSLAADNHLTSGQGDSVALSQDAVQGYLDEIEIQGDTVVFKGWAADVKHSRIPKSIIIFIDGKFIYAGRCNSSRLDVADHFGDPALQSAGFRYLLPLEKLRHIERAEIRVFAALDDGVVSELIVKWPPPTTK